MELQILRTRHPPEIYLSQLTALLDRELPSSDVEQVSQRIEELPKDDRLLLAVLGETLLGFAHLRIAHSLASRTAGRASAGDWLPRLRRGHVSLAGHICFFTRTLPEHQLMPSTRLSAIRNPPLLLNSCAISI
jgi:hypothetical protein